MENLKFHLWFPAQPYQIKDTKENAGFISMIKEAVENETPVQVFLKVNSNEIAKVEKATADDIRYFKTVFNKEERGDSKKQ